ncbi:hypothetical protein Ancab_018128 [Ancistrocladus abbreviatus]
MGETTDGGLYEIFQRDFGPVGSHSFEAARENFLISSAGYAAASLLLQPKDRLNGNLLFDSSVTPPYVLQTLSGMSQDSCKALAAGHGYERKCLSREMEVYSMSACLWRHMFCWTIFHVAYTLTRLNPDQSLFWPACNSFYPYTKLKGDYCIHCSVGRLVHIDFGFILETSLGGNMRFESVHFKLSHEMTQLLDPSRAMKNRTWNHFVGRVKYNRHWKVKQGGNREKPSYPGLQFTSREEDRVWLQDCWYGEVASIEDLLGLECKLKAKGVKDCNIHYLGGREGSEARWRISQELCKEGMESLMMEWGSVKKGIGGTVGLTSAAHLMESRGLKTNSKEAQMLQAESGKRENMRSFISPRTGCNLSQKEGQWIEKQRIEASKFLDSPKKASSSKFPQHQSENGRAR